MVVDIIVTVSLYKPLGIAGLVIGTFAANVVMTALLLRRLRAGFNGRIEGRQTMMITARILARLDHSRGVSWVSGTRSTICSAARSRPARLGRRRRRGRRLHLHARGPADGDPRGPPGSGDAALAAAAG